MPEFCDVALPVPLDMVFTYRLPPGMNPAVGSRVLVPFRNERRVGVVTEVHERAPGVEVKTVLEGLDPAPALSGELLRLGRWISEYYLAPLGEVFRSMLPLAAEFRRSASYHITEAGTRELYRAAGSGSSTRSRRTPADQDAEYRAL
ncbi:MAG: primosomal protein N', partial [Acidobacteria bacterium]|nr:primosomal protein N' [Acidobacteriota bacterium]